MSDQQTAFVGARLFDGTRLLQDRALLTENSRVTKIVAENAMPQSAQIVKLDGGILSPGFVDLQVNGGGGLMLNNDPSLDCIKVMATAHASIGATSILPTLITDTPDITQRAIKAAIDAVAAGLTGIEGLHLEGPHLSQSRKGAHDSGLIRPMNDDDMNMLIETAGQLPILKVTIAPESVSLDQIRKLAGAGILVSLGHTDATLGECSAASAAGARCATHLFNAMSQLGNREPGMVGGVLSQGELSAGIIADLIHVHPETIAAALSAKRGPGQIFLVSDAMATAGSDIDSFELNGRNIMRRGDRLTLSDGTLAGAHLTLSSAVKNLVDHVRCPLDKALAMATSIPAKLIGKSGSIGQLSAGSRSDLIHLSDDLILRSVWHGQTQIA